MALLKNTLSYQSLRKLAQLRGGKHWSCLPIFPSQVSCGETEYQQQKSICVKLISLFKNKTKQNRKKAKSPLNASKAGINQTACRIRHCSRWGCLLWVMALLWRNAQGQGQIMVVSNTPKSQTVTIIQLKYFWWQLPPAQNTGVFPLSHF